MITNLLTEIDKIWEPTGKEPITLPLIGSTAIFLQCDYQRETKDGDILEINELGEGITQKLKNLAGKNSSLAKKHKIYLDIVKDSFLFLPQQPLFHCLDVLSQQLNHFRIEALDILDVVVSKLKPFRLQDIDDIRQVISQDLIDPKLLVERFKLALEKLMIDQREDINECIDNLHTIQREFLFVPESEIKLPKWLNEI